MRQLGTEKRQSFYRRTIGQTVTVLIEETRDRKSGCLKGLTDNYIPVRLDGKDDLYNTFQPVVIQRIASDGTPEGKGMSAR